MDIHPESSEAVASNPIMDGIIAHELEHRGVDWREVEKGGDAALEEALLKYREYFDRQVQALAASSPEIAQRLTLAGAGADPFDVLRNLGLLAAGGSAAGFPDGAEAFPVWGWQKSRAEKYMSATGGAVEKDITKILSGFQSMEKKSESEVTAILYEMGILAFSREGVEAAMKYIEENRKRLVQERAQVIMAAISMGLKATRGGPVTAAVFTVMFAVLMPMLIFSLKSAVGTFIIINDTDEPMTMNGTKFSHGKCKMGFTSTIDTGTVVPVIPARAVCRTDGPPEEIVYAGFLMVSKKSAAWWGTRGAMGFAPTPHCASGPKLGWEVPLAQGSNKLLVSLNDQHSLPKFSDATGKHGQLNSTSAITAGGGVRNFTGHMNSGKGSYAYAFYSLS